jgi:hypothetical protein
VQHGTINMSNWERWIKRYVWDDERTPYLVPPERMIQRQANYEIFSYCVFLSCLFLVASLATASSPPAAFYALSILAAAIILGFTKHAYAATYCATVPIAVALHLVLGGISDNFAALDYVVLIFIIAFWAAYAFRITNIAKAYEHMPTT